MENGIFVFLRATNQPTLCMHSNSYRDLSQPVKRVFHHVILLENEMTNNLLILLKNGQVN